MDLIVSDGGWDEMDVSLVTEGLDYLDASH